MVDNGTLGTTLGENIGPIDVANLKRAHVLIESGRVRGKVVLEGFSNRPPSVCPATRRQGPGQWTAANTTMTHMRHEYPASCESRPTGIDWAGLQS